VRGLLARLREALRRRRRRLPRSPSEYPYLAVLAAEDPAALLQFLLDNPELVDGAGYDMKRGVVEIFIDEGGGGEEAWQEVE